MVRRDKVSNNQKRNVFGNIRVSLLTGLFNETSVITNAASANYGDWD
jgi:hypothetical protein